MKTTSIIAIVLAVVIGGISVYAISPYFTNSTIDEAIPEGTIAKPNMDETMMDETMMDETMMDETMMDETMMDETMVMTQYYEGSFVGVNDGIHNAEGKALILPLDDGSSILRLEDFESTNGPDLYVYLSTDDHASDFVSLGKLKANAGNQNYEIPSNVDLSKHNKVLIWCKAFGVLFGSAELYPQ